MIPAGISEIMPTRVTIARVIAIGADALQLGLFPLFSPGLASPLNVALDTAVCATLTWLVGWHVAFLPSFVAEQVPLFDLAPTWTLAILIKTRKQPPAPAPTPQPHAIPPRPMPSARGPVIDVEALPQTGKPVPAPPVLHPTATDIPPRLAPVPNAKPPIS
jgi:hypothetical protein